MRRIGLAVLVGLGLTLASLAAEAQPAGKVYRIGYLADYSPADFPARQEGFRQGLRDLGYIDGGNIVIEYRYAHGKSSDCPLWRPSWSGSTSISFTRPATLGSAPRRERHRQYPLWLPSLANWWRRGTSPASRGRAGTSLGCRQDNRSYTQNGWNCSRRPSPRSRVWPFSGIRVTPRTSPASGRRRSLPGHWAFGFSLWRCADLTT